MDSFFTSWKISRSDYIDNNKATASGELSFQSDNCGEFSLGMISGSLDCRYKQVHKRPFVEFSWKGMKGDQPDCGRGWARMVKEDTLEGVLIIHQQDEIDFVAKKMV